ncbi:MAG TPA: hypothetical protein PKE64_26780 [Anaerolineae bacterium]|nr:hypothetical protein [Anaerolineae bacterium]HMR67632.1 hypothetical protein [Anaerolineae bacterium]
MKWQDIRETYPNQWLLVEAVKAHSEQGKRILEELTVVNTFPDARTALKGYTQFHEEAPDRELFVLHTDRETLDITERRWIGIRRGPQ